MFGNILWLSLSAVPAVILWRTLTDWGRAIPPTRYNVTEFCNSIDFFPLPNSTYEMDDGLVVYAANCTDYGRRWRSCHPDRKTGKCTPKWIPAVWAYCLPTSLFLMCGAFFRENKSSLELEGLCLIFLWPIVLTLGVLLAAAKNSTQSRF